MEIDTTHPTFALTTHSTVAWTFTAPGGAYQIPMTVQPQPGSTAPTTRAVTLDVSYDDGVTWQPAR